MKKIILISFTSLLAVFAIIIAMFVMQERNFYGKPVELPKADYGKVGSGFYHTRYFFTIDEHGRIFDRDQSPLSVKQFEEYLIQNDCKNVNLRVDHRCTFEDLKPTLSVLYESEVLWGCFRVAEE